MNVLIFAPYSYPGRGGVESASWELAWRLARDHGWRVDLAKIHPLGPDEERGVRFHTLPAEFHVGSTPLGRWSGLIDVLLRKTQADVVFAHMPVPGLADIALRRAARANIPSILMYHNDVTSAGIFALPREAYRRVVFPHTARCAARIVVTTAAYASTSPWLDGVRGKLVVVPLGVRQLPFAAHAERNRSQVLFVSRLHPSARHKGLDILLAAMRTVVAKRSDARLVVVGAGPDLAHYRRLASTLCIASAVEFRGAVNEEGLARAYAASRVLALPSTTRAEGFGMVLIEAQSFGTPVIGSNVGGIPDALVDEGTGLVVPPRDADALAAAILRILGDDALAERFGQAARAFAREHTWERSAAMADSVLRSVVA